MSLANVAEQSLKGGDPAAALAQLQEQVRAAPADPKLRIFLFQLLCVLGQGALTAEVASIALTRWPWPRPTTLRVRCSGPARVRAKSPMIRPARAGWRCSSSRAARR